MAALPPGVSYASAASELAITQRGWWAPPYTSCMLASYSMILVKQGYQLPLKRGQHDYDGTTPKIENMVLALHKATGRPLSSGTTLQDTPNAVAALWSGKTEPKPIIHIGAVGKAAVIDLLANKDATIRISGGPLSALPLSWNLPAGHGNARHAMVLEGTRLSPTTGQRQVFLVDPMFRPITGYRGQWVKWDTLYAWVDKDDSGAVICTWGLPGEMLQAPAPPDGNGDHEMPPDPGGSGDDTMPALTAYQPGYTTTVAVGSNIRSGPSTKASKLRTTTAEEAWTITGTATGEQVSGSTDWLTRYNGGQWEYVHASLASAPNPPPSPAEVEQMTKALTDGLVSSEQTTKILRAGLA